MTSNARTHDFVVGIGLAPSRVPRDRIGYTFDVIKHRFNSPEASPGKYRGFGLLLRLILINGGIRKIGRAKHSSSGQTDETRLEKDPHHRRCPVLHELSPRKPLAG